MMRYHCPHVRTGRGAGSVRKCKKSGSCPLANARGSVTHCKAVSKRNRDCQGAACSIFQQFYANEAEPVFCFKNLMPSQAIASGVEARSRQMAAAALKASILKPKLSIVSQPS